MALIDVNNLTFSYETSYDNVFENVSFQIDTDWKLGLIGRNGRGKTTFLNLLLSKYDYQGSIISSVNFSYFPFEIENPEMDTIEVAKDIIAPFRKWKEEMDKCLEDKLSTTMDRYGQLLELYQNHDGYIIEELIEKELGLLQVDLSVLTRPFSTLSFGERTKIMLAALFLKKNNFLLIDEPTNHLDMEGRDILGDYLNSKKGFILVSHDRVFLDKCIDHVLSINRNNIEVQKGNFTSWKTNKDLQDQFELVKNKQLKKEIQELNHAANRTSTWSDKIEGQKIGGGPVDRGAIGHKSAKMMKRAKSIERRALESAEEKKGLLKNIEQIDSLKMNVLSFQKRRMVEAKDLSLYYDDRQISSDINFSLTKGDRIAIRGQNGSGKSTLFKLILGNDIKHSGHLYVAPSLKISYVSQETSHLKGSLKDFAYNNGLDETIFLTVLRQLGLSRVQFDKDISHFSGGQKKKVLLGKSLAEPAHLFIWDEPLNFIDIFSREQIQEVILAYEPTMIFVEHDRMFTDMIKTGEVVLDINP